MADILKNTTEKTCPQVRKCSKDKFVCQRIPQKFPRPKVTKYCLCSSKQERNSVCDSINKEVAHVGMKPNEAFSLEYANPLFDTSDPCSREIFEMFSSEAIHHLASLPEKATFLLVEIDGELKYEGVPACKENCKFCGDPEHETIKTTQENSFKNRFQVFSNSSEPTAVVEYECFKHARCNGDELPLFKITVTTSTERRIYEFAGFHMKECFPISVEDVVFCNESVVKLAFDFLMSIPNSPLHGVQNVVFWDVSPTFRSDKAMQREVLFFYPLSHTYGFKAEVDFLADGHGRPSDDFIIIPEVCHKRYIVVC